MTSTIPLGKQTVYIDQYDASLLFPIARSETREKLDLVPFKGEDCWTAYELSWLGSKGKPEVRLAEFYFDSDSPNIIESKSFKLYLNSLNQTRFESEDQVKQTLRSDLSLASGKACRLRLYTMDEPALALANLPGRCIDNIDIDIVNYEPNVSLLRIDSGQYVDDLCLYSHLLKTNCPVTGQPDWASLFVEYSGQHINIESLLAYIISFRGHQDFHENCVERIFCDIQKYCQPENLTVYARYTRRGGLDINPLRTNRAEEETSLLITSSKSMRIQRQ